MSTFQPVSVCGAACFADAAPGRRDSRRLGGSLLGAAALGATFAVAALCGLVVGMLPGRPAGRVAPTLLRAVARAILAALRITPSVDGRLPRGRTLVVANHISWLDIVALLAAAPADGRLRIVAKSEVATWPVIGRLARLSGTIFIDRSRPKTLPRTLSDVRDALRAGDTVAVFAEGTTSCGRHGVPYRAALFQAALDADARIVPVAIGYRDRDGALTPAAAFIGDDTLVASIGRVLGAPRIRVGLAVGSPLHPQAGASRRTLARMTKLATPVIATAAGRTVTAAVLVTAGGPVAAGVPVTTADRFAAGVPVAAAVPVAAGVPVAA
jgi:1-acyl-sn-glycerol-3-phosphate acyltransferase